MSEFPWYNSNILRAQIVAFVMAVVPLLGITLDFDVEQTVAAIMAGIAALAAVYTFVKRLFAPSPNLTATADAKEIELASEGKIPMDKVSAGNVAAVKEAP